MYTIDQIKSAHSKVKTGADFPKYVDELRELGVKRYVNYVADGHTEYGNSVNGPAKYAMRSIAPVADKTKLQQALKIHQSGGSDYPTFCEQAARFGVNSWVVDTTERTCIYYDKEGKEILKEKF